MRNEFEGNPWNDLAKTRNCLYTAGASRPGFHGDIQLVSIVESLLKDAKAFIETGTYHGCTAYYVAANCGVQVFTCDPSDEAYRISTGNLEVFGSKVKQYKADSPTMLSNIVEDHPELLEKFCVFWLDGHGDGRNQGPLIEELQFIFANFKDCCVIIDDTVVEGSKSFVFGDQFDFSWFAGSIPSDRYIYVPVDYEKSGYAHVGYTIVANREIISEFLRLT